MQAESQLKRHPFWHRLFSRKMGLWRVEMMNNETAQGCIVTRVVRYCSLCREDFHDGAEITGMIERAVGKPPKLEAVGNVVPLRENLEKEGEDTIVWPPPSRE